MLWIDSLKQASARLRLTCSWAGFWLVRPRLLWRRLADARQLYCSRCELAELDAARRVDLGVTDDQVAAELSKPILGELSLGVAGAARRGKRCQARRRPITAP